MLSPAPFGSDPLTETRRFGVVVVAGSGLTVLVGGVVSISHVVEDRIRADVTREVADTRCTDSQNVRALASGEPVETTDFIGRGLARDGTDRDGAVIRFGPPLSVRVKSAIVKLVGSIGLEKVTSTVDTTALRGLGEVAETAVIVGGARSMKALTIAAAETLPAASSAVA